nr:hypothetical protein [uncultured Cohaesibacter sp.]
MIKLIQIHGYKRVSSSDPEALCVDVTIAFDGVPERCPFIFRDGDTGLIAEAIQIDLATNNPVIEPADEPATVPPVEADYTKAIQTMLDQAAIERRYTSGDTMATYVNSTNAVWAAEARAFVAWRDAVWAYAYQQLAFVQSGERAQPTVEELLAELPSAAWPE